MKAILTTLLLNVFTLSLFAQTSWNINPDGVKIQFEYKKEKTNGTFSDLTAKISFDIKDLSKSSITASVPVNTLNTKSKMRDKHLLTDEFFASNEFPTISFTSKSFEKTDAGYKVTGTLTLKGVKHDETILFKFDNNTFTGKFTVDAAKYGVITKSKKEELVIIDLVVPVSK